MVERVRLAIAGAGIAGTAAALTAAQAGASVMLLGPPPSSGDRPGESLSVSAGAVMAELGLTELVKAGPHRTNLVTHAAWGLPVLAQRHAMMHPEGGGFVLDRPAFENGLAGRVEDAGIRWLRSSVVSAAPASGSGWAMTLSDGTSLAADFVIDCTGRAAIVARRHARPFRADRLVAAYGFLSRTDSEVEPTAATLIEAVQNGWWYASLLPDERLSLAFFSDPDLLPRGLSRDGGLWQGLADETRFIRRWLESATFEVATPPRLASAATTWLAPAAGEGWAAAGDAACAFDPLSSHGIATALWTGRRAALGAIAALSGNQGPLQAYAETLAGAATDFLLQRARIYGAERRWPQAPFWARRQR